jgi:hypothetical protein
MRLAGDPPCSATGAPVRRRPDAPRDLAADEAPGVGVRTLRGIFWAYGSYLVGRFLVLLSVAILAHLLSPSQFGLVGFALRRSTAMASERETQSQLSGAISPESSARRRSPPARSVTRSSSS